MAFKADADRPQNSGVELLSARENQARLKTAILKDPDVVLSDPDIMRALLTPSDQRRLDAPRQVVDLRSALIDRLERRLERLQEAHRDIVDAVWDSLQTIEQVHQAVLALIEAQDLAAVAQVARRDLPVILDVDFARLCVGVDAEVGEEAHYLPAGFVGARLLTEDLLDSRLLFTPAAPGLDAAVFELDAERVASSVYILLGEHGAHGVLALASSDPARFCARRNADLLKFLGAALERRLATLAPARPSHERTDAR